ncbi:MAG: hypothetical protein NC254_13715, partial [bacterium]|nr:hypothetical protein [bacterium]
NGMPNGTPNGYGQPASNGGMPNGALNAYGQPMPNGGMANGMPNGTPNGYGQPASNGPITVQGVDMKKRAKTGFIMSIVGAFFLAFAAFVAVINRDGLLGFTPVWTIWVCSMLYAGMATGYCYRGMASSKRGLAAAGFALGIIELVVGVLLLVFGVL